MDDQDYDLYGAPDIDITDYFKILKSLIDQDDKDVAERKKQMQGRDDLK